MKIIKSFNKKYSSISIISKAFLLYVGLNFVIISQSQLAFADHDKELDVYLVYTYKDKAIMSHLQEKLQKKNYHIKKYLLDYLVLADYTSKNKIKSQLNQAKVIVIITSDRVEKYIDIKTLHSDTIVIKDSIPKTLARIEKMINHNR